MLPLNPVAISVIVPFRNVEPHFFSMLESVMSQQVNDPFEVIAIDNASTDGSRAIAERFASRPNIRILDARDRSNASYARNIGARAAAGDKLLFLDADDEIAPGYVAALSSALDTHDFVTSRVDCHTLNPEWVRTAHGECWQDTGVAVGYDFMPVTGPNIGIRRSLFEIAGGYPEDFSGCQDIVFSWKVQLAGAPVHFVPEAVYRHRDSLRGLFRQCLNWGASDAQLYRVFRSHGMPSRRLGLALREWGEVSIGLLTSYDKAHMASFITRFGYCVGRVKGSMRFRGAGRLGVQPRFTKVQRACRDGAGHDGFVAIGIARDGGDGQQVTIARFELVSRSRTRGSVRVVNNATEKTKVAPTGSCAINSLSN